MFEVVSRSADTTGPDLVRACAAAQARRDAELLLALRGLAEDVRERIPESLLNELDAVVAESPRVAAILFQLPHMRQWCFTLKEFIRHQLDAEGVCSRMEIHAAELRRLRMSSRLAADPSVSFSTELIIQPTGSIHLPGTGILLKYDPARGGEQVVVSIREGSPSSADWISMRIGWAELWSSDLLVRRPGSRTYSFPLEDADNIRKWSREIHAFDTEIAERWPEFWPELRLLLKGIVSVDTPSSEAHLSSTFGEVPGALYASWTENVDVLREALVHEMFHTRLNCIIDDWNTTPKDAGGEYWAPWRLEFRPPLPFVHGIYAHYGMMCYSAKVAAHRHTSSWRSRMATQLVRLVIAQAQWASTRQPWPELHVIQLIVDRVFEDVLRYWSDWSRDLRDEILVAIAGEQWALQSSLSRRPDAGAGQAVVVTVLERLLQLRRELIE